MNIPPSFIQPRQLKEASLIITFKDGSTKELDLCKHVICLNHSGKQEIRFGETNKGWIMSYTDPTMEGKKVRAITFTNHTP